MKLTLAYCIVVAAFWALAFGARAVGDTLNQDKRTALRDAFKNLMDFKTIPINVTGVPQQRKKSAASRFMLALFEQYNHSPSSNGVIVRSILPKRGMINERDAIIFNIEAVGQREDVVKAELYYYAKHGSKLYYKHKHNHADEALALLPNGTYLPLMAEKAAGDWVKFGASKVVTALRSAHPQQTTFGAIISHRGRRGLVKQSSRTLLRHHMPFLLIYSRNVNDDHHDQGGEASASSNQDDDDSLSRKKRTRRAIVDDAAFYAYHVVPMEVNNHSDVSQNKGQDGPISQNISSHLTEFQRAGPRVLQTDDRRKGSKSKHGKFGGARKDDWSTFNVDIPVQSGSADTEPQYLGSPRVVTAGTAHGTQRRHRGRSRGHERRLPTQWQELPQYESEHDATIVLLRPEQQQPCRRHDLPIQFDDIGWGDWIISPRSFDAHYCAGTCAYPLHTAMRPTNHAYLQSIVHTTGLHPNVPPPCCAPDKMDSLTLLYYDEFQNVVLKTFPKMAVEKCGCL